MLLHVSVKQSNPHVPNRDTLDRVDQNNIQVHSIHKEDEREYLVEKSNEKNFSLLK